VARNTLGSSFFRISLQNVTWKQYQRSMTNNIIKRNSAGVLFWLAIYKHWLL